MTVQDFRGKTLVSIREFYLKDGKRFPSSRGNGIRYIWFGIDLHSLVVSIQDFFQCFCSCQ